MIKAFISYSFDNKDKFNSFDKQLRHFLKKNFNIKAYSLVFNFKKISSNRILMKKALKKIDESDLLIVELSHKSIGIGLEAGYAKAKRKKIIYIHKIGAELSSTVDGISDLRIEYKDIPDLFTQILKKRFLNILTPLH